MCQYISRAIARSYSCFSKLDFSRFSDVEASSEKQCLRPRAIRRAWSRARAMHGGIQQKFGEGGPSEALALARQTPTRKPEEQ
ncbi:hypothetical protein OOU_Y34scaffold00114g2 [Pyricularia oryzae Y34]|uniref:Uncharacterized protein n=1 Tax=Pyricularia oryzae (strain Y34) TaxID=1143189 RepID=A0AA97PR90_PYRO3|nr:hypothetical protein OOU_Y34scaffold00114g2 [Pyricularia oryzae Y34]